MSGANFETWRGMVATLARAGVPRPSPWWESFARDFYTSGAKEGLAEAGRGSGKSGAGLDLGLNEMVCGDWPVPVAERHWFILCSVRVDEVAARCTQAEGYLHALGVEHERSGNAIALRSARVGLLVVPSTVAGTSGPRGIGFFVDEAQKQGENLVEVVSSLRATTVTHSSARGFMFSSIYGPSSGYHARLIAEGSTARQFVRRGATWECAPWITEEQTRALEPDPIRWAREYANVRGADEAGAFDSDAVDRCIGAVAPVGAFGQPVLCIDSSRGKGDAWAAALVRWVQPATATPEAPPPPILLVGPMSVWSGKFSAEHPFDDIVAELAATAREAGATTAHGDQMEGYALESAFARHGIKFVAHAWTGGPAGNKPGAIVRLRRLLGEGRIALPADEKLRRELHAYTERATASGSSFGARTGHDDRVSVIVTAMLADERGWIALSPLERPRVAVAARVIGGNGRSGGASPSGAADALGEEWAKQSPGHRRIYERLRGRRF